VFNFLMAHMILAPVKLRVVKQANVNSHHVASG